ncbi:ABC transporter permease [Halorussus amylolyticus]|uniref:ABC transporter permease n=1 Tax=Halorussus amylolyticus TaxID=1126242 RepID=UPI001045AFE2|nr:ABC transporter permease [Halorussus amylolyticus]
MSRPIIANEEVADADGRDSRLARRDWAFLGVLAVLTVLLVADWRGAFRVDYVLFSYDFTGLDWLFVYALAVLAFYFVLPLAIKRRRTAAYWRRLRADRWATASFVVLVAFVLLGLFGPLVFHPDRPVFGEMGPYGVPLTQPPVGFDILWGGPCAGAEIDGRCHGTWQYPLGTTPGGKDVVGMIVAGTRVALEISVICVALLVPLATVVGTTAATYGGRVDEFLMRYVDIQQSIPAFFVIILAQETLGYINKDTGGSLLLVVLVFGFMNWGGIARIVRSEALELQEQSHVHAARIAGMSEFRIVRTHVVPNALSTIFTAVTVQISWLLLLETTLSFLGIGSKVHPSWGYVMTTSARSDFFPTHHWWGVLFPAIVLAVAVVALQILGDALRDVTDPRMK